MSDDKQRLQCPECEAVGSLDDGTFESNLGKINETLSYLCTKCHAHIDIGSCDGCHKYLAIDLLATDEPPFLCADCLLKQEETPPLRSARGRQ